MKRNRQYAWRIDWVCGLAYIYGTNAQTTVEAGGDEKSDSEIKNYKLK